MIPVADHFSTYLNDPSDNTFKFDLVTERDVAYIIHNLKNKKSYGHDYLSNILLKRAQATLVKPLTFLINQTLTTGIFPRELKISRVFFFIYTVLIERAIHNSMCSNALIHTYKGIHNYTCI